MSVDEFSSHQSHLVTHKHPNVHQNGAIGKYIVNIELLTGVFT